MCSRRFRENPTLARRGTQVASHLRRPRFRAIGVFVIGALLGAMFPLVAFAQPPTSCREFEKQLQSYESANTDSHTGVKTNLSFASPSDDCVRVSTIGMVSINESGYVEWGWVLGYDGGPCGDNYHSSPTLFIMWPGTEIDTKSMVFHKGNNFLLTERNSSGDPGFGNFLTLKKALESGGGSFQDFTNPAVKFDADDGYKFCKVSDTNVKHIENSATCS